jgi:hypothetical protein
MKYTFKVLIKILKQNYCKGRWQGSIKTDLKKQDARAGNGFKRLRLGSDDEVCDQRDTHPSSIKDQNYLSSSITINLSTMNRYCHGPLLVIQHCHCTVEYFCVRSHAHSW